VRDNQRSDAGFGQSNTEESGYPADLQYRHSSRKIKSMKDGENRRVAHLLTGLACRVPVPLRPRKMPITKELLLIYFS